VLGHARDAQARTPCHGKDMQRCIQTLALTHQLQKSEPDPIYPTALNLTPFISPAPEK
jgi:hypothetical protein